MRDLQTMPHLLFRENVTPHTVRIHRRVLDIPKRPNSTHVTYAEKTSLSTETESFLSPFCLTGFLSVPRGARSLS